MAGGGGVGAGASAWGTRKCFPNVLVTSTLTLSIHCARALVPQDLDLSNATWKVCVWSRLCCFGSLFFVFFCLVPCPCSDVLCRDRLSYTFDSARFLA